MNERMGTLGAKSLLEIDETRLGVGKLAALQVTTLATWPSFRKRAPMRLRTSNPDLGFDKLEELNI